jgi:hypothetical protein
VLPVDVLNNRHDFSSYYDIFISLASNYMLQRCAEPVEVARPILFLCSNDASFITAVDLPVEGGHMQMWASEHYSIHDCLFLTCQSNQINEE